LPQEAAFVHEVRADDGLDLAEPAASVVFEQLRLALAWFAALCVASELKGDQLAAFIAGLDQPRR
jgi:hypothetical protein